MPRPMKAKTRRSFKGEGSTTGKNQPNYDPLQRAIDRVIREREASGDPYPREGSFEEQNRYRLESQAIAREKGYFVPLMPRREVTSIEYLPNPGRAEREMAREARGGMGASATEDLLERLTQYKRNAYGNKYEQGGEVKKKGSTIKIAGQYAYEPIATTESGEQYVTMELPDGTMATVFGDWETYGNPSQEGYIEDLDYIIYPLGDGTYALDVAEAETEMLREESREVSRQAGTEVEDLLQELNQRGGMGFTPSGRMRPVKKQ